MDNENHLFRHVALDPVFTAVLEWPQYRAALAVRQSINLKGKVLLLNCGWGGEFYHFYINVLGRLAEFERWGGFFDEVDYIILPAPRKYIEEWINIIGLPREKIVYIPGGIGQVAGIHIFADELLVPSFCAQPNRLVAAYLRNKLSLKPNQQKRRLLHSRSLVSSNRGRHIARQQEIFEQVLAPLGFEIFIPENYSVREQAQIHREAELIIFPHGASATNLFFCPAGAIALEIIGKNRPSFVFDSTAELVGVNYFHHFTDVDEQGNYLLSPETMMQLIKHLGIH